MKKIIILLIVIASIAKQSLAQNKIDSLLALIKTDKQDTNRVIHLNKLSWQYISIISFDSALFFANQALVIANSLPNGVGRGWASSSYNAIGVVYFQQGNFPKALDYYLKALKIDEELNDKSGIANVLVNIGIFYKDQGDYQKALDYYFKALKIDEELLEQAQRSGNVNKIREYRKGIAADLSNIGLTYYEQKDYSKSLDRYFKALKIDKELGNKNGIAIRLG
ncbi:MAG TPA: tetratricopeptide repeat protein, partial [Bacteroidia bacterium]